MKHFYLGPKRIYCDEREPSRPEDYPTGVGFLSLEVARLLINYSYYLIDHDLVYDIEDPLLPEKLHLIGILETCREVSITNLCIYVSGVLLKRIEGKTVTLGCTTITEQEFDYIERLLEATALFSSSRVA